MKPRAVVKFSAWTDLDEHGEDEIGLRHGNITADCVVEITNEVSIQVLIDPATRSDDVIALLGCVIEQVKKGCLREETGRDARRTQAMLVGSSEEREDGWDILTCSLDVAFALREAQIYQEEELRPSVAKLPRWARECSEDRLLPRGDSTGDFLRETLTA